MIKLNLQLLGGRGASLGGGTSAAKTLDSVVKREFAITQEVAADYAELGTDRGNVKRDLAVEDTNDKSYARGLAAYTNFANSEDYGDRVRRHTKQALEQALRHARYHRGVQLNGFSKTLFEGTHEAFDGFIERRDRAKRIEKAIRDALR